MDENYLKLLAQEYIHDVSKICNTLLKFYNLNSKEELIKFRKKNPHGEFYLNGINIFTFHGSGCSFSSKELEIDWDFGFGDLWCGLDPWKLFYYIKNKKRIINYNDGYDIEKIFIQLVANKEMIKKINLYYFI